MRWLRERLDPWTSALLVASSVACLAISSAESWRAAVLGIAASTAVVATRVRFSVYGAACLLVLVALLAVTGSS